MTTKRDTASRDHHNDLALVVDALLQGKHPDTEEREAAMRLRDSLPDDFEYTRDDGPRTEADRVRKEQADALREEDNKAKAQWLKDKDKH